jgi:hypothetical protein
LTCYKFLYSFAEAKADPGVRGVMPAGSLARGTARADCVTCEAISP